MGLETEAKRFRTLLTPPPPAAAAGNAASVALVLGNVDILCEILLLLDAPSHLVRATLVSKHWLRAAADPSFLRRFRARSPPHLLGFLASFRCATINRQLDVALTVTRFVPLPHPPELDGAAFDGGVQTMGLVVGCRNGRVLVKHGGHYGTRYSVRTPLRSSPPSAEPTVARLSAVPPQQVRNAMEPDIRCAQLELLPYPGIDDPREALTGFGDLTNCFTDRYERIIQQAVYVWQRRQWAVHVSPPLHFPVPVEDNHEPYSVLVGGRWLCMTTVLGWIIIFDLDTVTFSFVGFPNLSVAQHSQDHILARAGDSGIYLVHVKGVELHVWLFQDFEGGNEAFCQWERVEIVHLPRVFRGHVAKGFWNYVYALDSNMLDHRDQNCYRVRIHAVGDDAEFVFLTLGNLGGVFLLDIKRRTVKKVLQTSRENDGGRLCGISAFMMPWPPVFPALKETTGDDEDGDEQVHPVASSSSLFEN